jgi:hypothetical protein
MKREMSKSYNNPPLKNNLLEIGDLYLAVFIKSKYGLKIADMKKERGRVTFVFDTDRVDGQELIRNYYNGDDKISANAFVKELKDMKALVHNF